MERSFGTDQDRLVKQLRLAKVTTLQDANKFLEAEYWPEWNERFARSLNGVVDLHRALTPQIDLASALSHVEQRVVSNDYTFSFASRRYQIARSGVKAGMRGKNMRVELHLNGALRARFEGQYVDVSECGANAASGEAGGKASAEGSQSGRQERLDGRLLRTSWTGVVASGAHGQREKLSGADRSSQKGAPGKNGPAIFAFLCPKPPLGNFTKSIPSYKTGKPSRRYAPVGGLTPTAFGANSVASALGSSAKRDPGSRRSNLPWEAVPAAQNRNVLLCSE